MLAIVYPDIYCYLVGFKSDANNCCASVERLNAKTEAVFGVKCSFNKSLE